MKKKSIFESMYIGIDEWKGTSILYNAKGEYSFILETQNLVEQYSANIDLYYTYNEFINSLIRTLGEGYAIQKHDIFCRQGYEAKTEKKNFLSKAYFSFFKGRKYTEIKTYFIITQEKPKSGVFQYDKKKWIEFHTKIQKIIDVFNENKIEVRKLNENEIKEYIYRFLSFSFEKGNFHFNNFFSGESEIKIGKKKVRSISVIDTGDLNLPKQLRPFRIDNIKGNQIPSDIMCFLPTVPEADCIVYNQAIIIPSQRQEKAKLSRKKNQRSSLPDPANEHAAKDIESVLDTLEKDNKLLVYTHFNIIVSSSTDLELSCNYVENQLDKSGIRPSRNAFNQLELFQAASPGCVYFTNPKYDRFLTLNDAAACFLYKEKISGDEETPLEIFYTNRNGIPKAIDITGKEGKNKLTDNSNFFSLGPSGSGKSFHMNSVCRQLYEQGTDIVMVDTGNSYEGLCSYVGGKYISYTDEKPITMNPFKITQEENNIEKRDFLKNLILLIWKGADGIIAKRDSEVIDRVISLYYEYYFNPFNGYTQEEKEVMRESLLLTYQTSGKIYDQQTELEIKNEYLKDKIEKLQKLADGSEADGEKRNAERGIQSLLEKENTSLIELYGPEERMMIYIEKQIEKRELRMKKIRVESLSFNTFFEFCQQMIPIICEEGEITFDMADFKFILRKFYKGGQLESTLNDDMDKSLFDETFIVFEIDAIKDNPILFPIVTLIIMDLFIQKMRIKKNRKALIIEEAWKAIASPLMADYIKYLYKTVRKFWGIVGVVTQEIDDIISSPVVKEAIINNSQITILLDQSKFKERYAKIAELLGLSEVECRKIWTINALDNKEGRSFFKEVYIRRGAIGDVYGVEEPPECYMAYTTERAEKEGLKDYIRKYNNIQDAIANFCKDWKKSGEKSAMDFVLKQKKEKK